MARRVVFLAGLLALGACSPPRYPAVRDWAGTAGIGAAHPEFVRPPQAAPTAADAALAMQQVLEAYLAALGTLALAGRLAFAEPPFAAQSARVAPVSPEAADAITAIGAQLHRATVPDAERRALRETLRAADPPVQVLLAALAAQVEAAGQRDRPERAAIAAEYARLLRQARGPAERRALQDLDTLREREVATDHAAYATYRQVLARIGEGHALLAARAGHLGQEETFRQLRAAEDALRRAMALLPPPLPAPAPQPLAGPRR